MSLVPEGSRVLDIGGGNGWVADELAERKNCTVTIIDDFFRRQSETKHTKILYDYKNSKTLDFNVPKVDYVLLLDVIEHISRQRHVALLDKLRRDLDDPPAMVIISVPNTAFLPLRLSFALLGRLNYGRRGILDDTHAFLFTKHSLHELMEECGYDIHSWQHIPPPYELALVSGFMPRLLTSINAIAARMAPSMFAYQHLIEASPRPTVATLIRHSFENSK
jgi:2-polyprenyl-3-methyl-5-hydroxy-6-metoxy-1,4-benzoquinol methylase